MSPLTGLPGSVVVRHTVRVAVDMTADYATVGRLVSGEAVELDVRVARIGSRVLAFLLDLMIKAVLGLILFNGLQLLVIAGGSRVDDALAAGLGVCVLLFVLVAFPVALEVLTRGRSLGKLAMGLRVVRDDGGPIAFRHALTRAVVCFAVEWPGVVLPPFTWLASLWITLVNPHGKRLGDLAAGTIVIHDRTPQSWGWIPRMPVGLAAWAATLDLSGLDDDLALTVRHYLARNRQISEPTRTRLGMALASEVAERTTPPPPPGVAGWAYLAAVLAERHRRAASRLAQQRAVAAQVWPELANPPRLMLALPGPGVPPIGFPAAAPLVPPSLRPPAPGWQRPAV